ncbi:MAG TPA: GNAT family N-acetyltransferase [Saprospiraceae bacterium]|nr:GNAT family N-acetyltransferase [Saprospiraceae bacterium]
MYVYQCVHFKKLTVDQLYAIISLREDVFVVEQNCPYLDADGKDFKAYHLMLWDNDTLIGYSRILPKAVSYEKYPSLGRITTKLDYRGKNLGKELVQHCLRWCGILFPGETIKISAQSRLEKFYQDLGFILTGEHYLEDDIPHSGMLYYSGE